MGSPPERVAIHLGTAMTRRPRTIFALDLGATTGWAVLVDGEYRAGGSKKFDGSRLDRLRRFQAWLNTFVEGWEPDAVVYERPFCRGLGATRSLWGMAGVTEAVASSSAAVLDVNLQTIKKWAGAKGRMSKDVTTEKCRSLGVEPRDDNHADAVCLAFYAAETMEIEE
jgi:Holliday junction resolvasome RuvABC endonuclease subunit